MATKPKNVPYSKPNPVGQPTTSRYGPKTSISIAAAKSYRVDSNGTSANMAASDTR